MMLQYCANLKAIRYESTSSNRTVADKLQRVVVTLRNQGVVALVGHRTHFVPVLSEMSTLQFKFMILLPQLIYHG